MGARELLDELADAGLRVEAAGDKLLIRPATKLTDELRAALRAAKPELLALLSPPATEPHQRPYRLSTAEGDYCHAEPWDEAAIARFVGRVSLLMRRGFDATDDDDLAERLHLRDVQSDDRVLCAECRHYRRGQCGNHRAAGLHGAEMSRDLAVTPQWCPGFDESK